MDLVLKKRFEMISLVRNSSLKKSSLKKSSLKKLLLFSRRKIVSF